MKLVSFQSMEAFKELVSKGYLEMNEKYVNDLPFEETLLRHSTKPNRDDFGEPEMRRWWRGKDCLSIIKETIFDKDLSLEDAVEMIYQEVTSK